MKQNFKCDSYLWESVGLSNPFWRALNTSKIIVYVSKHPLILASCSWGIIYILNISLSLSPEWSGIWFVNRKAWIKLLPPFSFLEWCSALWYLAASVTGNLSECKLNKSMFYFLVFCSLYLLSLPQFVVNVFNLQLFWFIFYFPY